MKIGTWSNHIGRKVVYHHQDKKRSAIHRIPCTILSIEGDMCVVSVPIGQSSFPFTVNINTLEFT